MISRDLLLKMISRNLSCHLNCSSQGKLTVFARIFWAYSRKLLQRQKALPGRNATKKKVFYKQITSSPFTFENMLYSSFVPLNKNCLLQEHCLSEGILSQQVIRHWDRMSSKRSNVPMWKNSVTKFRQHVLDKAVSRTTQRKFSDFFART